jgi:hypothetical protein
MNQFPYRRIVIFSILLVVASSVVPGERQEYYADVNCTPCKVVAAGFPLPYIADYPGLSPTHSANLQGVVFGLDKFRLNAFCADLVIYLAICTAIYGLISHRRHPRSTHSSSL